MRCNDHFGVLARGMELRGMPRPQIHIAIGNRFTRIAYKMVAGGQAYHTQRRHPRRSIIIQS